MSRITKITSQKKGDRLNVFIGGEFSFSVDYATAVKFSLKVGDELSDEKISQIEIEEGISAAYNQGLKYAVKKTVSEKQIKKYLNNKGFSSLSVEEAVKKLKVYGYVDDISYANAFVATYGSEKGRLRLRFELKEAGIDDEIIDTAVKNADENACDKCADKFLRTRKNSDKQKLYNYLSYRGFESDEIKQTLSRRGLWK